MTMSVIGTFKIGEVSLDNNSKSRIDLKSRANTLQGYTVTECSLTKELLKPNEFSFTLRRDSLTKTAKDTTYNLLKSLIGKVVDCKIMTTVKVGDTIQVTYLLFKGNIYNVSLKGSSFNCVAYSPDASLQGAPKSRCFINTKISDVVNTVASEIDHRQVLLQAALDKLVFPLIIQYNESDYDFLARLAKRFGAFCYFGFDAARNTSSFVFGKLPSDTIVDLTTDAKKCSVAGVSYELQTGDPTYRYAAHYYEKNEDYKSPGADFDLVEAEHNGKMELVVDGSTKSGNQNFFCGLANWPCCFSCRR